MIFLFDNCYLSTTNQIIERSKQVWIGNHTKLQNDIHYTKAFDILRVYETITDNELDLLFKEIHENYSDTKIIINCDLPNFEYIYYFYFGSLLNIEAVDELYSLDRLKENYGFFYKVNAIIPEKQQNISNFSRYAPSLKQIRVEVVFANYVNGNNDVKQWLIDRVNSIWNSSPGLDKERGVRLLPALLTNEEYTIENLLNENFVDSYLENFNSDDFIPNKMNTKIEQLFECNVTDHFMTVINNNTDWYDDWNNVLLYNKKEFIENCLLNVNFKHKLELIFPTIEHFHSVNPFIWNAVVKNFKNKIWLNKYIIKHGINN